MCTKKQNPLHRSPQSQTCRNPVARMKTAAVWVLVLMLAMPFLAQAQDLSEDPRVASALHLLNLWVDAQLAYERIPGISMGVVHDQQLVWSRGFGYADVERKVPATPRTIYSICSISKLFTSIGVLQLRDQGLLRLDDPVANHLSWFTIEQRHEESPPITVEGLLTHSSGLPRESDFPYWTEASFPSRKEMIQRLSEQETLYPSRINFQYSNLGLSLAGEIVAQVSGKPYAEYVKQNIIDPLGLEDTSPEIPVEKQGGQLATGYSSFKRDGARMTMPFYRVRGIAPAAGYASTVEDLAKFASWQFRLLEHGGTEILAANTLREMHRVHWLDPDWKTTWGLGFSVWRNDDKTFVGHGGSCPGYRTHLLLRPQEKFAAIFMTNAQGVNTSMYTQRAYDIVAPAINEATESPGEGKQPDPKWLIYTGMYERPYGGETAVLIWKGELAMVSFPTENPLNSLTKLKHKSEHTFNRIRDDGELGEEVEFEVGDDGKVIRVWRNSNYSIKVR
jgi:CubicO group peptidase (beta-lactamase class C family)